LPLARCKDQPKGINLRDFTLPVQMGREGRGSPTGSTDFFFFFPSSHGPLPVPSHVPSYEGRFNSLSKREAVEVFIDKPVGPFIARGPSADECVLQGLATY